jgi:hypothetical protein
LGLRANRDKTEAIWIGASSNFRHKPLGIKWTSESVRLLGVLINRDYEKMIQENFRERLKKIENLLQLWCLRKMTLKGKIIIVNTLIITQLLYLCTVLELPVWVVEHYNKLVLDFIWNSKPPKVKYSCMINQIDEGGLKLQDLETKSKAIKLKWIKDIVRLKYNPLWKAYLATFFKSPIQYIPVYNMSVEDCPKLTQEFYNSIFVTWCTIHNLSPSNAEHVCKECLWNNSLDRKSVV